MRKYNLKRQPRQLPDGTIEIQLTKNQVCYVDSVDAEQSLCNWIALTSRGTWYALRNYMEKPLLLHRVIASKMLDRELGHDEFIDHIDGDTLNNRRANLRIVTHSQNCMNRKVTSANTSGYKGVWNRGNRWYAGIKIQGKRIHLGSFDTAEEAYAAYCEAAQEIHGEFARLK